MHKRATTLPVGAQSSVLVRSERVASLGRDACFPTSAEAVLVLVWVLLAFPWLADRLRAPAVPLPERG